MLILNRKLYNNNKQNRYCAKYHKLWCQIMVLCKKKEQNSIFLTTLDILTERLRAATDLVHKKISCTGNQIRFPI